MGRTCSPDRAKKHGIQYTPPELAQFLAEQLQLALPNEHGPLTVLDPACGDGELLHAFWRTLKQEAPAQLTLVGYETDASAIERAKKRLTVLAAEQLVLEHRDFLADIGRKARALPVDVMIANPPYVRTQTLGEKQSRRLAARYGLQGRIDLSQAFVAAMARRLRPDGVIGLIISNRFLTTRTGASLRALFASDFEVLSLYDLGDTRLFPAAVLPAIVIARKGRKSPSSTSLFHRIYECAASAGAGPALSPPATILRAVADQSVCGTVQTASGTYQIERGRLPTNTGTEPWSLQTPGSQLWLAQVRSRQKFCFGDLARVRVGIKTTADNVFIRSDWRDIPGQRRPEAELLKPLLTHHEAGRWLATQGEPRAQVLYPHETHAGKRRVIELRDYPRAARYLESFRSQLEARRYLSDAGRRWYEIWVPHQPSAWSQAKVVWPDISILPQFFLDQSNAVVNGDCYWMALREGIPADWLLLLLAIANSTLAIRFYDILFHNKLYSGRRRFMTQYVAEFPVPDPSSRVAVRIVELTRRLLASPAIDPAAEEHLNHLVWQAFGLDEGCATPDDE